MIEIYLQKPQEAPVPEFILTEDPVTQEPARVMLYNDEWHFFEEVIFQIMKATGCTFEKAEEITLEVHHQGKSIVYTGEMKECLKVSGVLEEIALHTQIIL